MKFQPGVMNEDLLSGVMILLPPFLELIRLSAEFPGGLHGVTELCFIPPAEAEVINEKSRKLNIT